MSRIIRNSALNGLAMGITSLLSLVLVPVLIGHYGLLAYGLIPLVRLLTPLGAMGIVALGLPQLATRAAALHATQGQPEQLKRIQSTVVALSILLGAAAAAVMFGVGAARFAHWFNIDQPQQPAFAAGFNAAALLFPLLLPGFVLSASLTGLGQFRVLRVTEVSIYLLYFAASILAVLASQPIQTVVMALLAADALRAATLLVHSQRRSLIGVHAVLRPELRWFATQMRELTVLSAAGLLGYARKHLASGTIAVVFGPAGLGLYDAIERVPRALKSLLGLVNTAVLPHAMRLDVAADSARLRSLLVRGTRLTLLCMVPLTITAMLYAGPIISAWLGKNLAYAAAYLVLLLIPFILDASLSLITTATLSRLDLISQQNKIAVLEILLFLGLLFLILNLAGDMAPYVATAGAAIVGYALRLRVFLPAYAIARWAWVTMLAKILGGSAAGACVVLAAHIAGAPSLFPLSSIPLAVLAATSAVILLWSADERKDVRAVLTSLRSIVAAARWR